MSERTVVTHENFDACFDRAKRGETALYIPAAYRTTKINAKCIAKFEAIGRAVIKKDTDGKGFRLSRGNHYDYVFQGGLIEGGV
jgi:hypothetical protein